MFSKNELKVLSLGWKLSKYCKRFKTDTFGTNETRKLHNFNSFVEEKIHETNFMMQVTPDIETGVVNLGMPPLQGPCFAHADLILVSAQLSPMFFAPNFVWHISLVRLNLANT